MDDTMKVYFLSDDRFSKYYGLTAQEVGSLVRKFYDTHRNAEIEMRISDINANYNGYYQRSSSGENKESARYCLFSVLNYISEINKDKNNVNLRFWTDGGFLTSQLVPILKKSHAIMSAVHTLLCGDSGTIAIQYQSAINVKNLHGLFLQDMVPYPSAIFNFLLQRGYLAYNLEKPKEKVAEGVIHVRIPNREIKDPEAIKSKFTSCGLIFKSLPTQNSTQFQESLAKLCEDLKCLFGSMQCETEVSICCSIWAILKFFADYEKGETEYAVKYFDNNNEPCQVKFMFGGAVATSP